MESFNPELVQFLKDMEQKYRDLPDSPKRYLDQFNLDGKEFTKSMRNYCDKIIKHFDRRIKDNTEKQDFRAMIKALAAFISAASKLNKRDFKGNKYGKKVYDIYYSIMAPKPVRVYKNSGRRRMVEVDKDVRRVTRREEVKEVDEVRSLADRLFKAEFGRWPEETREY